MKTAIRLSLLASLIGLAACAGVPEQQANLDTSKPVTQIADGHLAAPPPGFISFCMHNLSVCTGQEQPAPAKVVLDDHSRALLTAINDQINRAIAYRSDYQNFGVANRWRLDAVGSSGDCKDYALAKQQALIAAGLPKEALRIAIVKTPRDELHAVLTVDTDKGDFVLDSINPIIVPWSDTSYSWLSRQSAGDPLRWVSLARNF